MDGERFDAWTRRAALRLLAGAGGGLLAARGPEDAAAACVPAGRRCGDGKHCCADAACKGGRCRCKPGVVACFAGAWPAPYPYSVAADGVGHVYVGTTAGVLKYSSAGRLAERWRVGGGEAGVAVDGAGHVYVAGYDRVRKFDGAGALLAEWATSPGTGQLAVDPAGRAYVGVWDVTSSPSARVEKFASPDGVAYARVATWEGVSPSGLAADGAGHVYVLDHPVYRITKFDGDGNALAEWDAADFGEEGFFGEENGLAVDEAGHVHVTNGFYRGRGFTHPQCVLTLDGAGRLLGTWGRGGTGPGQFRVPRGVATDGAGHVYVADSDNNRVQKFLLA